MKVLAREKPVAGVTDGQFTSQLLLAEAAKAWELHRAGAIRELYFTADEREAVLILECADEEEAREILSRLPLVQAGLIDFHISPLVAYDGFARLFADAAW